MSTFELIKRLRLQKKHEEIINKYNEKIKILKLLISYSVSLNMFFISNYIDLLIYNIFWVILIYYIIFFYDKIWKQVIK